LEDRAAPARLPEDRLVDEFEADSAVADPAHDAARAVLVAERNVELFADARLDVGHDHRPARGDVGDGDLLAAAAEDDRRTLDQATVAVLGALVGDSRLLAFYGDPGQAAEAAASPFRLGLAGDRRDGRRVAGKDR
jgi:hypothetical protein